MVYSSLGIAMALQRAGEQFMGLCFEMYRELQTEMRRHHIVFVVKYSFSVFPFRVMFLFSFLTH